MRHVDPLGLAWGDFPPLPTGFDEGWSIGRFPNGPWYLEDPGGTRYIAHPEDWGHWRHWDRQGPGGKDDGMSPPNSKKMWPLQKKPKPDQCEVDPNADAPPWQPPTDVFNLIVPPIGPEWRMIPPVRVPFPVLVPP